MILVRKDLLSAKLIFQITVEKRMCANEIEIKSYKLIILSIHKQPTGYFNQLIKNIDDALKHLHKLQADLLICGDINTDNLIVSN